MNNPDRVELGSEEQVRDGKSGGAPEWLRPAFHIGGRAFLGLLAVGGVDKLINAAVTELQDHPSAYTQKLSLTETIEFLTKGITSAEAAELCTGSVLSLGFKVVDHPTLGREKITDPTDFALGAANFTEVQAYDQEGAKRLAELARLPKDDPDRIDLTNRPKPITSDNMVNRGMYSHATVTFEDEKSARECNTKDENGHPALKVWLHFPAPKPEDDDFATYPAIISKGKTRIHVAGRVESRVDELNKIADDKTLQILPVGMWVDRAVKELRGYQLNSFKAPSGTAEIISETNRQLIREQVKTLLKQKEEADKAKKAEEEDKSLDELREDIDDLKSEIQALNRGGKDEVNDAEGQPAGFKLPEITIPDLSAAGEVGKSAADLPGKLVDQVTERDVEPPARWGIDLAGWLVALGLLLNRPARIRTRLWNTVALIWRSPIYWVRLLRHRRGGVGLAPVAPPGLFSD